MGIGQRIKEIRLKNGLTQEELRLLLGSPAQSKISNMEKNDKQITLNDILIICKELKVSSDYLLFGYEVENRPTDERFTYLTEDESNIIELMLKQAEKRHMSETKEYDKIANL